MDLTPTDIAELRARINKQTIAARTSGKPVVNLLIVEGPLDGLPLTMLDDETMGALVGWSVVQQTGPVSVMHKRHGYILRFTGIESGPR